MNNGISVAVFEDDGADLKRLISAAGASPIKPTIDTYSDINALVAAAVSGRYQAVFLDIYKDGLPCGIDAAREIRKHSSDTIIAFTTANSGHTLESYGIGALKYILKPVSTAQIEEALILAKLKHDAKKTVALKRNGMFLEFTLDDILYIFKSGHNTTVHMKNGDYVLSREEKMDDIYSKLPSPPFNRCHKSYIVNFAHVKSIDRDFAMSDGSKVYIRQKDKSKLASDFSKWILENVGYNNES
jgi:DNA-binding LytR/AlgR family response regulator